jgi:hypothetical protein
MQTAAQVQVIRAWNLLSNGQGGFDWAGLPVVCEHLGIADAGALIDALMVIKLHDSGGQHNGAGNPDD